MSDTTVYAPREILCCYKKLAILRAFGKSHSLITGRNKISSKEKPDMFRGVAVTRSEQLQLGGGDGRPAGGRRDPQVCAVHRAKVSASATPRSRPALLGHDVSNTYGRLTIFFPKCKYVTTT